MQGLSVRQTEMLVAKKIAARGASQRTKAKGPDLSDMERRVSDAIGYRVSITTNRRGGGDVSITFSDLYQLEDIVDRLTREPGRARYGAGDLTVSLHQLALQEAQRRQGAPRSRQIGAPDRLHRIEWRRLAGVPQEVGVVIYLLFAPGLVSQGFEAAGKDRGHARGAPDGRDDRPKLVVAIVVQTDGLNHGMESWLDWRRRSRGFVRVASASTVARRPLVRTEAPRRTGVVTAAEILCWRVNASGCRVVRE